MTIDKVINLVILIFSAYIALDRKKAAREAIDFYSKWQLPHVSQKTIELSFLIGGIVGTFVMVYSILKDYI